MFDNYLVEIEKNHLQVQALCAEDRRTDEETLRLFALLRKNDELIKGAKLEVASDTSKIIKPEQAAKLKDLEREHNKCSKIAQGAKGAFPMEKNDGHSDRQYERIRRHEEKMENMNQAKRNVYQTTNIATDVKEQLDRDFEAFARQRQSIKLLNQEIILSNELISKIEIQDKYSRYLFYAGLAIPIFLIIVGLVLRVVRSASA